MIGLFFIHFKKLIRDFFLHHQIVLISVIMKLTKQFCFQHPSGEDIYLFNLFNNTGTEVCITNLGAIVTGFTIRNSKGNENDIVLGFENVIDYLDPAYQKDYPWMGCAVGRYANRIKNARFELEGKLYILSKNKGDDHLHGGLEGFDKKTWKIKNYGADKFCFLELEYLSRDGEEGFPGNLLVTIRFELNADNELSYEYHATTDKATAVNLTHHGYFNLNNGQNSIHDHELKIYGSRLLVQDKGLVVTGETSGITNSEFDFIHFKKLFSDVSPDFDYDKTFIIDAGETKTPELAAELRSVNSGVHLQVFTTNPVVHFYAGKWIPKVRGKKDALYGPFSGLCLETHNYCNAVNIPQFPSSILRPGEAYWQKTVYKVMQGS